MSAENNNQKEKVEETQNNQKDSEGRNLDENGRDIDQLDDKKTVFSWALYDWANSAFATTVMAGFFPLFFEAYWSVNVDTTTTTYYLGLGNSIASIIVAAMAPFLGAIADKMSGKKKLLSFFAFLGIIMTGGLWLISAGKWQMAITFYILGTVGFSGGNIFYDSLLTGVASDEKVDYVSSLGFAMGYIGGGVLFTINVLMFLMPETFGLVDDVQAIKISFLSVGIWWAVFSIPIMIWVKEPYLENSLPLKKAVKGGWKQLKSTFQEIRHLKYVGMFLLGYWFYIDGVDTIIKMAVDYGTSLGFESSDLITALLITQFVAFPGTLLFNKFAKKIGVKRGVLVAIGAYIGITVGGFYMNDETDFYVLAILIGCFQGGIQALSRSLYSRLIPKKKSAEFYGFFNMLGKFAAVLGPVMIGVVSRQTGSNRYGILSIIVLFIIGGIILYLVDLEEGEKMAKKYLTEI